MACELDPLIAAAKPGDVIQLNSGLYYTDGCDGYPNPTGVVIPSGVKLAGAGKLRTIIKFRRKDLLDRQWLALYGKGDGITISDLSVDCGPVAPGWPHKICGIVTDGSSLSILNCNVVRPYGLVASDNEGFAITMLSGTNHTVQGCSIHSVQGDYVTGITMRNGIITGNNIVFPPRPAVVTPGLFWSGINPGTSVGVEASFNVVTNGVNGFYTDTGTSTLLNVHDNIFNNVACGVHINMQDAGPSQVEQGVSNSLFADNRIVLDTGWGWSCAVLLDNTVAPYDANAVTAKNWISNIKFERLEALAVTGGPIAMANIASQVKAGANIGIRDITFKSCVYPAGSTWRNMGGNATGLSVSNDVDPGWTTQ
jgi:hypothetical protein